MNEVDWTEIVGAANADIRGIIRAQRVKAEIDDELGRRADTPVEEDFIFADAFGHDPREPRRVEINGVEVLVRTLHRRGLNMADVKGADLLYEIAGRKFVLIQYKRPNGRGSIQRDVQQLRDLVDACPNPCPPASPHLWPTCGSWFAVVGIDEHTYVRACDAESNFGAAQSRPARTFTNGLSRDTFDELFARCWIGARTAPSDLAYTAWSLFNSDNVLFSAVQFGGW